MSQVSIFDVLNDVVTPSQAAPARPSVHPVNVPALTAEEARRRFIREFSLTARYHHRWDVFRDFITLVASELDIARIRTPENIAASRKICDRYQAADLERFHALFRLLTSALQGKYHDFLGSVFMELELGSGDMGQFFTPYPVARLLTQLLLDHTLQQLKTCPWVTLNEPTSGAGGMVIAFAEGMLDKGLNPSAQLMAVTTDIDPTAADMTFIQLSLLGIPAVVNTGNTLSLSVSRTRYTPVWYFSNWQERLDSHGRVQAMRRFMASM